MSWETFYLICFGLGLAMTALSLAGLSHHHLHLGFHHVPQVGHAPASSSHGTPVLNGFTLTVFLCWFGGAGYLLARFGGFIVPLIVLFATVSGLIGSAFIFWFLTRVIGPHDKAMTSEETEMCGVLGRVIGTIRAEGTGEILFSQNGTRRSSPARSEGGQPIAREVEVVVMRYERGIAYVRRWDEVSGGESLSPAPAERQA